MLILSIQFTAGRYHGTPWDAHVNEGRVEWPPSPWRFVRALLAVGHGKLGWNGTVPDEAKVLVETMAQMLPSYRLPAGAESHVRHYMPVIEGKNEKKSKVFDAFFRVDDPREPLLVAWPSLDESHRPLLAQLVESLAYLGRAESWVEAKVLTAEEAATLGDISFEKGWCVPVDEIPGTAENLRLPAPMLSEKCAEILMELAKPLAPKKRKTFPLDLLTCLHLETSQWQKEGWSSPPGLRWVDYACVKEREAQTSQREEKCFASCEGGASRSQAEAILLALFGDGKKGTVLPRLSRCLPLGESLHAAGVRAAEKVAPGHPMLTGCDADGKPQRDHRHAHFLPLCLSGGDRVDHVLVWSGDKAKPFDAAALRALAGVSRAYAKDIESLDIREAGRGSVAEIMKQLGAGKEALQSGSLWESRTPLVLRQYANRGYRTPENQIRKELEARGFDNLETVEFKPWGRASTMRDFVLRRKEMGKDGKRNPQPPMTVGWHVSLRFTIPQDGPICLGYGSHFGLGLFTRIE